MELRDSFLVCILLVAGAAVPEETCSNAASAAETGSSMLMTKSSLSKASAAGQAGDVPSQVHQKEWELFELLNQLRAEGFTCGDDWVFEPDSTPLVFDCRLWRASYLHSKDMADNHYAGHHSQDGRSPVDRAQEQGVPPDEHRNAENLGFGNAEAHEVLEGWKGSEAHCRTMMHPDLTMFGVGYVGRPSSDWRHYWTLMLSWSTTGLDESCYPNNTGWRTPAPTQAPTCGAPSNCKGDVDWAWYAGRHWHAGWYGENLRVFAGITGDSDAAVVQSASYDDFQRIFFCGGYGENRKCALPPCQCTNPPCDTCTTG